ncbi:MAG: lipid A phosphoethanolamine transferase [Muribaculaceae bacterium]|nr:lipid A phosphoethanolamine transferase [Muribaculaceae bacterium]
MRLSSRRLPDILFIWLIITLAIPNVLLSFTENLSIWGRVANIALPVGIIGLLASLSRRVGRTVWLMFPLIFFAAFQIVLLWLYGRSVIAVDMFLNLITTNATEVGELLGNLWPSIIIVCVLYLPSLILAIVMMRKKMTLTCAAMMAVRRISGVLTVVGLVALAGCYLTPGAYSMKRDLYPVNVCYNLWLAVDRTSRTARYHDTSADYTFSARAEHPDSIREICVLVIGETSRATDWQLLGYDRPTTPRLSKRDGLLVAPQAYSESNTTHKSVPMLLSPVDALNFNDSIYKVKSLITAFKEAGWHTAFLSNQLPNRSFIDFFGEEADTTIFIKNIPDAETTPGDFPLLPHLKEILRVEAPKQLVVLHTYGSHFNYRDRYGDEDRVFTPDDFPEAARSYRDRLVNAYDNTIVATDRFIDSVIGMIDSVGCSAGLLYTSDHGEDIYDNGSGRFLHASPLPSETQVHVPLLVWLSHIYAEENPDIADALSANISSAISTSRSFFPTALTLGGIVTGREVDTTASLGSATYKPRTQLYLDDHNRPVPLTEMLK